ncbi:MAG: hypothetical protein HZC41_03915 [Chloroflexi bacterium]|nr:hypothetical protein [Chloroflexota bacterium]
MVEQLLQIQAEQDVFAAIESLQRQADPATVMRTCTEATRHYYWQAKDVVRAVMIGWVGMQYGLTTALGQNAESAYELRSAAKGLAYDIASFTWPGWDEPGIRLDPSLLALGLEAAKVNLRLAQELDKGDLQLARAYWMLGAQQLAAGQHKSAADNFRQSAAYAERAGSAGEAWLARAFAQLTALAAAPANRQAAAELAACRQRLADIEPEFVQQVETATRVFVRPPP